MISPDDPILDWHFNSSLPEAPQVLAESRVVEFITPRSPDKIWQQLDANCPKWKIWDRQQEGAGWTLLPDDYLYHPNIGTLIPAAMAWLWDEKIVVYKYQLICIVQADDSFTVGRIV